MEIKGAGSRVGARVWSAPDHVAGADRDLGPVRESWAVVRGDADVALVCRLRRAVAELVRQAVRSVPRRVAALDATRFHARGLAAAAAAASDAGWLRRSVNGGRDDARRTRRRQSGERGGFFGRGAGGVGVLFFFC